MRPLGILVVLLSTTSLLHIGQSVSPSGGTKLGPEEAVSGPPSLVASLDTSEKSSTNGTASEPGTLLLWYLG